MYAFCKYLTLLKCLISLFECFLTYQPFFKVKFFTVVVCVNICSTEVLGIQTAMS